MAQHTSTTPDLDQDPAQDLGPSVGDTLRTIARHIDDYDLPTPISITSLDPAPGPATGHRVHVQVRHTDYPAWTTAMTTWTGETSLPWDGAVHYFALGTIARTPVQLVTVQRAVA